MKKEIISLENVGVNYNGEAVLRNINLSVKENDFLAIIGPNGGGKTTLLKVMLGLIIPICGEIRVFGQVPRKSRNLIGYVPQYSVFDREFPITVWETVLMGCLGKAGLFRNYSAADEKLAKEALEVVEMFELRGRPIGQLSVGQRQRIFIARALVAGPSLLLLDEPTASIDMPMQTGIYKLLNKLKEKITIILVTHDIGVVSSFVDKIACLNRELYYHNSKEIPQKDLEKVYGCPVELIAHGVPHRVIREHRFN